MDNLKEATLQSELRFKDLVINPCHRSVLINNNRIDLCRSSVFFVLSSMILSIEYLDTSPYSVNL